MVLQFQRRWIIKYAEFSKLIFASNLWDFFVPRVLFFISIIRKRKTFTTKTRLIRTTQFILSGVVSWRRAITLVGKEKKAFKSWWCEVSDFVWVFSCQRESHPINWCKNVSSHLFESPLVPYGPDRLLKMPATSVPHWANIAQREYNGR